MKEAAIKVEVIEEVIKAVVKEAAIKEVVVGLAEIEADEVDLVVAAVNIHFFLDYFFNF